MRFSVWAAMLIAACYRPNFDECAISCNSATGCPSGLTCDMAMGLCSSHGSCSMRNDASGSEPMGDGSGSCAWPFTVSNFDPCALPAVAANPLRNGPINSDDTSCDYPFNGRTVCLLHVPSVDLSASGLVVTGSRPLIIVSDDTVAVNQVIEFNAANATAGSACDATSVVGIGAYLPGGGGGGHGQAGSPGGTGGQIPGGSGGDTMGSSDLEPLEMGCPGADGGGNGNVASATAGRGGGALQISSRTMLTVDALVTVNGGGGSGGTYSASAGVYGGGAGGGAGGSILLEADQVVLGSSAETCAIGGGGGQGRYGTGSGGASGSIAQACEEPTGGGTGAQPGRGGFGGDGGPSTPTAGQGASATSGGGGGGGAGRITIHSNMMVQVNGSSQSFPGYVRR